MWVGICKIVVRGLYAVFTQTVYDGLFRRKETESCRLVSVDPYRQLSSMAIRWHMGFSDNDFQGGGYSVGNAFDKFPLAVLLHIADLQATYLDETGDKA